MLPEYILDISTTFDEMKKRIVLFLFTIFLIQHSSFAQNVKDTPRVRTDSGRMISKKKAAVARKKSGDTVNKQITGIPVLTDSIKKEPVANRKTRFTQRKEPDTLKKKDSLVLNDTTASNDALSSKTTNGGVTSAQQKALSIRKLISENKYLNLNAEPVYFLEEPHRVSGKEFLFYCLCAVLLILAVFKTIFSGYFKNLFRVYFNTSLRQTQLSDQLEQAKLPSFILNIFFTITAGIYIWLLFRYYHPPRLISAKVLLPFCIVSVAAIYFIKYCLLKFMGWVSAVPQTTNKYIFAIFLVNKITGIILVPIIILLAFSSASWRMIITNGSFFIIGLFFLSRYFKSYTALDKKVRIHPFHFVIYIAAAEVIPLLLIYKIAIDYFI